MMSHTVYLGLLLLQGDVAERIAVEVLCEFGELALALEVIELASECESHVAALKRWYKGALFDQPTVLYDGRRPFGHGSTRDVCCVVFSINDDNQQYNG